jgi:hypothetical protein
MTWKAIGESVAGSSHVSSGKPCEDAIMYDVFRGTDGEVLICCASDGAGSARFGGWASAYTVKTAFETLSGLAVQDMEITEANIYAMAEDILEGLEQEATEQDAELNEFSCTLLGAYVSNNRACFFQVGDGAIVRNDGSGFYIPVWWPFNGEYQNTTSFLVDDPTFSHLNVLILDEPVNELAIFTDGLQMLALNTEVQNVHQPFFEPFFKYLRLADSEDKVMVLNRKLAEYLDSKLINGRTDDDKTLFLATRGH